MSADPGGKRILEQLAAELDGIQELDVNVRSEHLGTHKGSSELRSSAIATVKYRRRVDTWELQGKTTQVLPWRADSGAPFELSAAQGRATLLISFAKGDRPQSYRDAGSALEVLRGVTRGTANVIPDMLLPQPFEEPQWNLTGKRMLDYLAERARLNGEEAFEGYPCYRVRAVQETGTWTLWIDKRALLPRGVKMTADGDQIKSSGVGLGGTITHMESMHHLDITHVK